MIGTQHQVIELPVGKVARIVVGWCREHVLTVRSMHNKPIVSNTDNSQWYLSLRPPLTCWPSRCAAKLVYADLKATPAEWLPKALP